jgi:propionyl-CoA carboxylase beta chain
MSYESRFQELQDRARRALEGGGAKRIEKQHAAGKLTARERIDSLLDPESFQELDKLAVTKHSDFGPIEDPAVGDGVVSGYGTVAGRTVFVFAQDFTVNGGSLSAANARKIVKIMDQAMKVGAPVIALNDSGGARIQEGVRSLAGYADIFLRNTLASGVVPQISAIMGPCAGGAVYSPALTDFIFMVQDTSYMFVTGPDVIKAVTHEEVTKDELGGAMTHNKTSGVAHFATKDDRACIAMIRELLSYIPSNNLEEPPTVPTNDPIDRETSKITDIVPDNPNLPYDIKKVIQEVMDDGRFFEVQPHFGKAIVIGFARLAGKSVGIVANQPNYMAGALDIDSSTKGARFVRFCDAFNIPIVTFEDVPGFLPGTQQEFGGIIRHGAKLLYAYSEATVPKLTVITRKAYGGAYCVMASKHLRTDINFAYPTAEIAVMGSEGAVNILYRREIAGAEDQDARRKELTDDYTSKFATPFVAAEEGYLDEVIHPKDTRHYLARALLMLEKKRDYMPPKKHGNMPL